VSSTGYNWYATICKFVTTYFPDYKASGIDITVERDEESTGARTIYILDSMLPIDHMPAGRFLLCENPATVESTGRSLSSQMKKLLSEGGSLADFEPLLNTDLWRHKWGDWFDIEGYNMQREIKSQYIHREITRLKHLENESPAMISRC
jgi:hypothetical protein